MRSLVTGATGYLGHALTRLLARENGPASVTGLVRDPLPESERDRADDLRARGVRLLPADLLRSPVCDAAGLEFNVLYHLAAETDSGASARRLLVNTEGTRKLLETLGDRLSGARVVLAGATAAVDRRRRPRRLMTEKDPPAPRTRYGTSKLLAERIVEELADRYGYSYTVPRFSPVWTEAFDSGFLGAFAAQAAGGSLLRKVPWPGRITIIHREDAARTLKFLGETGLGDGRGILVGDGNVYRYRDLLRDLRRAAGEEDPRFLPVPRILWAFLRHAAWWPLLRRVFPWRLSCLLGDDLAVDAGLLRILYPDPFRPFRAAAQPPSRDISSLSAGAEPGERSSE